METILKGIKTNKENIMIKAWYKIRKIVVKLFRKNKIEDQFLSAWTQTLNGNAEIYRGLYTGLRRIADGKAKRQERVIHEWHMRTQYNISDDNLKQLSTDILLPLSEHGSDEEFQKWTGLLLKAAEAAGIRQEAVGKVTLDEGNESAYAEWNGEPIYLGDTVEVTVGAWYQDGKIMEQGYCNKQEET